VFFKRLRNVLFVWLLLAALLVFYSSLSQRDRDYNRLESSFVDGLVPVISLFNAVKSSVLSVWNRYLSLKDSQKENERLKKEIALLRAEKVQLHEAVQSLGRLKKMLAMKNEISGPSQVAEVVGRGPSPFLQALYINKGRREGLERGMAVLHPDGVVGRVERTSQHYAKVLLLPDPNFAIDCYDLRSRVRGILTGLSGEGVCQVKYVARTEDIKTGDILVTSGLDQVFPKGLVLGVVSQVVAQTKGNFIYIEAVPAARLSKVEEVLVLQKRPPLPGLDEAKGD
jgi:rod shape-determining protein MreC